MAGSLQAMPNALVVHPGVNENLKAVDCLVVMLFVDSDRQGVAGEL